MRYQKAEDVLPKQLLAEVQKYADGVYLYIPRRADHRQSWGNSTRYREELRQRNESIRHLRREGRSASEMSPSGICAGRDEAPGSWRSGFTCR